MSLEVLGLVSLGALFAAIALGFPISFTLIILGIVFGILGFGERVFYLMTYQFMSTLTTSVLAAVPLFLFMGYLLEYAGLVERLFRAFQKLMGGVRGSLYLAVMVTATVFAAATGIVGASVTLLGLMAGPSMMKSGYDTRLSAGAIAAGGTLGILIPPSVMLVVLGPVLQVSIARLYAAAIFPGLLLSALFILYAMGRSFLQPSVGPALPTEKGASSSLSVLGELLSGAIPVTVLILATLGSILAGMATPTEGAGMGAFGTLVLTLAYRRLNLAMLKEAVLRTAETTSMIMILIAASNFYGAVFSRLGTPRLIAETLLGFGFPPTGFLLLILVAIFILGWPLEWVPIVVIVVPIFLPLVKELGLNLLWFGTLVAVALQTAWLSPPVALSAYFLKGVVPEWDLKDIYWGMAQFMVLQVVGLMILVFFPEISLWLPNFLFG